jgi:hypothetical protein
MGPLFRELLEEEHRRSQAPRTRTMAAIAAEEQVQ